MKNSKGITLVALVVTIIILIILAGISINLVLGEHGLITMAKKAKENMELAQVEEQEGLNSLYEQLYENSIGESENSGNSGNTQGSENEKPNPQGPQIKDYLSQEGVSKNTTVYDRYYNPMVIPTGFHIVMPEEDNTVEYNYTGDGTPSVQDGIVVADSEGNQFVWIPVGIIHDKNEGKTMITLGRYEKEKYTGSIFDVKNGTYEIDGYTEDTKTTHNTECKNIIAKDIDKFIYNACINQGYYLARYEASYNGTGAKPLSQPSKEILNTTRKESPTKKGQLWNNITQPVAATKAGAMYESNDFTSDLVNSYAWDTAIIFIQKYSPGNENYASQSSRNTDLGNTGERPDGTTDKACNIYDIASNCSECTTETHGDKYSLYTCVYRGGAAVGKYNTDDYYASFRDYGDEQYAYYNYLSFRVALYINVN